MLFKTIETLTVAPGADPDRLDQWLLCLKVQRDTLGGHHHYPCSQVQKEAAS